VAQYAILIYVDEAASEGVGADEFQRMMGDYQAFNEANTGALRGGNKLAPTATATTIRRDAAGRPVVTDGAFAETKEALGGYYLIEAADLDEAIAIARQVPVRFGGVEVRPVEVLS
jgi:hypothetical protein